MLIKEYRIPLPLTVEEYRIAQLYMIAVSQYLAKYLENILNHKTHKSIGLIHIIKYILLLMMCRKKVVMKVKGLAAVSKS